MIHDSQRGFGFSWLNSLLSWAFLQQDKKQKALELSMDLWYLSTKEVMLTLQTLTLLNFVLLFLVLILLHLWNQIAMCLY